MVRSDLSFSERCLCPRNAHNTAVYVLIIVAMPVRERLQLRRGYSPLLALTFMSASQGGVSA